MKNSTNKDTDNIRGKSSGVVSVATMAIVVAILSASIIPSESLMTNVASAQPVVDSTESNNQTQVGQLKFYLKLSDGASQNGTQVESSLKNITVNVNVQQGQEQPKKLPITAVVPEQTTLEQLELCASIGDKPEQCQPLSGESISLDLTGQQQEQNASTQTMSTDAPITSDSIDALDNMKSQQHLVSIQSNDFKYIPVGFNYGNDFELSTTVYSPAIEYYMPVQLVDDVNVDVDVTAIIPIDVEIENAQVCANLGGTQTCQINNINPTTYEYSPTTIDLASQEPTVTTQPTTTSPTESTTTSPTESTTTSPTESTTTSPTESTTTSPTESTTTSPTESTTTSPTESTTTSPTESTTTSPTESTTTSPTESSSESSSGDDSNSNTSN